MRWETNSAAVGSRTIGGWLPVDPQEIVLRRVLAPEMKSVAVDGGVQHAVIPEMRLSFHGQLLSVLCRRHALSVLRYPIPLRPQYSKKLLPFNLFHALLQDVVLSVR